MTRRRYRPTKLHRHEQVEARPATAFARAVLLPAALLGTWYLSIWLFAGG